ncbi:MAG: hypothetical protein ACI9VR_000102 [Cognaticolwellia sp.]
MKSELLYVASTASGSGSLNHAVRPAKVTFLDGFLNLGRLSSGSLLEQSHILMQEISGLDGEPFPEGEGDQPIGFVQEHIECTTLPCTLRLGFGRDLHDCLCFGWMRALHRSENPGVTHTLQRIRLDLLAGGRLAETRSNRDFALDASWEEVEDQELEEVDRLWAALSAPDPTLLNLLLLEAKLPHIKRAAQILSERFPSHTDGLCDWERRILKQLQPDMRVAELIAQCIVQASMFEPPRPYELLAHLRALGPLVDRELPWRVFQQESSRLSMSQTGQAVLAGEPAFAHLPYTRWVGGIALRAPHGLWVQGPNGQIIAR